MTHNSRKSVGESNNINNQLNSNVQVYSMYHLIIKPLDLFLLEECLQFFKSTTTYVKQICITHLNLWPNCHQLNDIVVNTIHTRVYGIKYMISLALRHTFWPFLCKGLMLNPLVFIKSSSLNFNNIVTETPYYFIQTCKVSLVLNANVTNICLLTSKIKVVKAQSSSA